MMAMLVKYTVMSSVIFLMLGVGLNTSFADVIKVARQVGLVLRGVVANFVIVPVMVYLALLWLPIGSDIKIGIMLMAAAPVAPMAPPFVGMAKGDLAYSVGLMTIVALLSVPLTPLILSFSLPSSDEGLALNPWEIIQTLLFVQLIPIGAAMTIRQQRPQLAETLLKFVPKVGQVGLLIGVGLLLAKQFQQILTIDLFSHIVMLILVIGSLAVGHLMMVGKSEELKKSLAITTAIRNIPLAFLIANASFQGTVTGPVTLVFSVYTMLLSVVYGKLRMFMVGEDETAMMREFDSATPEGIADR